MSSKHCKHMVDILLGVGLLLLMSYQVTGEAGHEWTGIVMTVLMILHQILNRKWYAALFKGKYTPLRTVQTLVNAGMLPCYAGGCFLISSREMPCAGSGICNASPPSRISAFSGLRNSSRPDLARMAALCLSSGQSGFP